MNWRIYLTCLVLGICFSQAVQSLKTTHAIEDSAKTSDFLFDDEDLALADQASGSGPVPASNLDDDNVEEDIIDEDDISVVDDKNIKAPEAPATTPAPPPPPPVTPKVSAVASKPEPLAPSFSDDDGFSGSGNGDTDDNYDNTDDDDDIDETSITGEDEGEDDVEEAVDTIGRNAAPVDPRIVPQTSTPAATPAATPEAPREENQIPVVTSPPATSGPALPPVDTNETGNGGSHVLGHKPEDRPVSFFAQPGILAAVVGGAVVGLLCAILLVMFIVYRMRKKDEGSYALDEPKRSPNSYSYNKNSREFFA